MVINKFDKYKKLSYIRYGRNSPPLQNVMVELCMLIHPDKKRKVCKDCGLPVITINHN